MADEQKPIQTAPIIPPVADTGIANSVPTVSGTERLNTVIPELKLQPELKGIVKIEDQPDNQIESPIPAPKKTVEINRAPSGSIPIVGQAQQEPPKETESDNPKVMPIEEAKKRVAKRVIPIPQINGEIEEMDAADALGHLEVRAEEWEEERKEEAA